MCQIDDFEDDDITPPDASYKQGLEAGGPEVKWCQRCRRPIYKVEWNAHLVSHDHAYANGDTFRTDEDTKRKLDRLMQDVIGKLGL